MDSQLTTEVNAKLLPDVRNYLDITYEDTETDKKLTGIIERGVNYLQGIAGSSTPVDFTVEGNARSLLFDYCLYARSNSLYMFEQNYKSSLVALRLAREVAEYVSETDTTV